MTPFEGCNTFGPWTFGPPQSSSGQTVPNQFSPHGQMVPKHLVPMDKWSPTNLAPLEYSVCPGGQAVGIRKYGDQIGWEPFVQGDRFYGDRFSMETEFVGDHLSREMDLKGIVCPGGQEVRARKSGIKWVRDQLRSSSVPTDLAN